MPQQQDPYIFQGSLQDYYGNGGWLGTSYNDSTGSAVDELLGSLGIARNTYAQDGVPVGDDIETSRYGSQIGDLAGLSQRLADMGYTLAHRRTGDGGASLDLIDASGNVARSSRAGQAETWLDKNALAIVLAMAGGGLAAQAAGGAGAAAGAGGAEAAAGGVAAGGSAGGAAAGSAGLGSGIAGNAGMMAGEYMAGGAAGGAAGAGTAGAVGGTGITLGGVSAGGGGAAASQYALGSAAGAGAGSAAGAGAGAAGAGAGASGGLMSGVTNYLSGSGGASLAGNLVGGYMQSRAADRAADAQVGAAREGNALLAHQYDTTREDFRPWREAGAWSLGEQRNLLADPSAITRDPSYQFELGEGRKAIEGSAAARGGLFSGDTLRRLQRYGQDFASTKLNDAFGRYAALSGTGQAATGSVANAGQNYANNASGNMLAAGNARGAGYVGRSNAWTGAIGNALGDYQQQQYINQLRNGG